MKKTLLLTCLICSALVLSACASTGTDGASNSLGGSSRQTGLAGIFSSIFSTRRSTTLTAEEKLAIGTIKLDASGQAIDRAEAAKLLPLWQLLHQLYASSSAAPQEETAVMDQIRSTMTPSQVASIDSMQLSRSDIFAALQQGQANTSAGSNGAGTGTTRSGSSAGGSGSRGQGFLFGGGGGFGGGGFGGGGFRNATGSGTGSSGSTTTTQQSLTSAQRAAAATSAMTNALINQVISLLQDKLSS